MPKNVVVIGGGIAGLTAAVELLKAGCRVTVLETKRRLGGRIHTVVHNFVPVELGAEFLHGQNKSMIDVLQAAGLSTQTVNIDNRILLPNGKFRRVDLWTRLETLIDKIDPRKRDCSFSQFIRTHHCNNETKRLAVAFVEGFNAAGASRISAHALLRGQYAAEHMADPSQSRITEGYGALVEFYEGIIRSLGGRVMLGVSVRQILWRRGNVRVHAQRRQIPAASTYRAQYDAAVVTLPLGVLKANVVKFSPSLTHKVEAVRSLQFGNALRVNLVFKERWWPEKDFGFVQALKEPIPTWWGSRGAVMTGWAGGPKADVLVNRSLKQIGELSVSVLARIFSRRPSFIRRQLAVMKVHNWARDPHIRGAYSYVPVNGLDLPKALAAPVENTLFFAGEATVMDAQCGTVTGALESGLRAAQELLED